MLVARALVACVRAAGARVREGIKIDIPIERAVGAKTKVQSCATNAKLIEIEIHSVCVLQRYDTDAPKIEIGE